MTGDLILRYEAVSAERGDHLKPSFVGLGFGVDKFMRRLDRSLNPDKAAMTEAKDAIRQNGLEAHARPILKSVIRGLSRCESPIEKLLLPWLIAQSYPKFHYRPQLLFPGQGALLEDMCVAVVPQLPLGAYRADFALASRRGKHVKLVVVECDGAEFHESEEQKARDEKRDAYLLSRKDVLAVVRFTGTQIYRDPERCACTAARVLYESRLVSNKAVSHKFEDVA